MANRSASQVHWSNNSTQEQKEKKHGQAQLTPFHCTNDTRERTYSRGRVNRGDGHSVVSSSDGSAVKPCFTSSLCETLKGKHKFHTVQSYKTPFKIMMHPLIIEIQAQFMLCVTKNQLQVRHTVQI